MVEMNETANIVNNATERSLIILDEIGRGTSTFDGLSIAWSVAEFLHDKIKARTLFATHYHELTKLAIERKGVVNFNVAVREWNEQIIFLRKIVPGGADKSYGIQVARLAGLPHGNPGSRQRHSCPFGEPKRRGRSHQSKKKKIGASPSAGAEAAARFAVGRGDSSQQPPEPDLHVRAGPSRTGNGEPPLPCGSLALSRARQPNGSAVWNDIAPASVEAPKSGITR